MNRAEYWILNSVVLSPNPLHELLDKEAVIDGMNIPWHGLSSDALVDTLYRLFQRGDLAAARGGVETDLDLSQNVTLARQEIEQALSLHPRQQGTDRSSNALYYYLTLQGGARWEAVSQPDWNRYISETYYAAPERGEITGCDRRRIEQCYTIWLHSIGVSVVAGSEIWDEIAPWQATYWKTLPYGYRLRFLYTILEETISEEAPSQEPCHSRSWYINYLDR